MCLIFASTQHFQAFANINSPAVCLQEEEERGKRQVLVLGLDGAGKSSMLQGLTPGDSGAKRGRCRPTRGFNFMSLNAPACQLDFLESKAPFIRPNQTLLCVESSEHWCFIKQHEMEKWKEHNCSVQLAICFIKLPWIKQLCRHAGDALWKTGFIKC